MYNCPTFFLLWKCLADMSYWTNLYLTVADNELHFFTISNLNYTVFVSLAHMRLCPQAGCTEEEKETSWEQMDQELSATIDEERVIVGGDLNGHIGSSREGIERIHGGWGMGDRNDEGENIVETAMAFDLAIVNTFFEKKVNQYVTYNSGGRESQIDFLMCRRCHLNEMINCMVINGEAVAAQHRLLVMDWEIQRGKKRKPEQATPRIKWWRLKEDDLKVQFREKVLDKVRPVESVLEWWEETSTTILRVGQEVLGMKTGWRPPGDKETYGGGMTRCRM